MTAPASAGRPDPLQGPALAVAMAACGASPLSFVIAATGTMSFQALASEAIAPAIVAWLAVFALSRAAGWRDMTRAFQTAIPAGILATVALEIVRIVGFRAFATMPGSMPELMGVLIMNQFMLGPTPLSDLVGWGDHFVNGISFAFLYIAVAGRARWYWGTLYALAIGTIFMLSPVMAITGAGLFGQSYAPVAFPLTVYLAHIAFGTTLGLCAAFFPWTPSPSLFAASLRTVARPVLMMAEGGK